MMTCTRVMGLEVARTIDCTLKGEPRPFEGELAMECEREALRLIPRQLPKTLAG